MEGRPSRKIISAYSTSLKAARKLMDLSEARSDTITLPEKNGGFWVCVLESNQKSVAGIAVTRPPAFCAASLSASAESDAEQW